MGGGSWSLPAPVGERGGVGSGIAPKLGTNVGWDKEELKGAKLGADTARLWPLECQDELEGSGKRKEVGFKSFLSWVLSLVLAEVMRRWLMCEDADEDGEVVVGGEVDEGRRRICFSV